MVQSRRNAQATVVALLALAGGLTGCSELHWLGLGGVQDRVARLPQGLSAATAPIADADKLTAMRQYRVGKGDQLQISLKGIGASLGKVTVNDSGETTLPRKGEARVEGLTLDQIGAMIEDEKGGGVTVSLILPPEVYVAGAVVSPGAVPYRDGLTLGGLLDLAGGATYKADLRTVMIKPRHADKESAAAFDAALPILPGDVVRLEERYF